MTFPTATPSVSAPVAVGPVVKTLHIGHDLAIDLGDHVLVASKSEPDSWHVVTTSPATCTCKGHAYRGWCSHQVVALQAQFAGIEGALPIAPTPTYYDAEGHTFSADEIKAQQEAARVKVQAILDAGDDDYLSSESIKARRVAAAQPVAVGQHPSQTERWL